MEGRGPLFREIHKNTWLKRIPIENRKIAVGNKKTERCWVVFCVHDDCEALLEGYAEPRLAATHSPDWTISLQTTLHISHALVPSEQEYEFVITLLSETVRFNANSWEVMQEWVDTLRLKLREMKILSPKENLYSKLPEARPPLLPTRDPMSPLPATPPIPAAIVPGVERVIPANLTSNIRTIAPPISIANPTSHPTAEPPDQQQNITDITVAVESVSTSSDTTSATTTITAIPIPSTSMSNMLTQNLINMLSNPVSAYSSQVNGMMSESEASSLVLDGEPEEISMEAPTLHLAPESSTALEDASSNESDISNRSEVKKDNLSSLAKTFANNVLSDPNTFASTSGLSSYVGHSLIKNDTIAGSSVDTDLDEGSCESMPLSIFQKQEPIVIPRPQTGRNGEGKEAKRQSLPSTSELSDDQATTNITIIQVSSPLHSRKLKDTTVSQLELPEIAIAEDENYRSNVQIIPSNFTSPIPAVTSNSVEAKVTTVQVSSSGVTYGKILKKGNQLKPIAVSNVCRNTATTIGGDVSETPSTTIRNFGPITNIPINADNATSSTTQLHYEQVFVTPPPTSTPKISDGNDPLSPKFTFVNKQQKSTSHNEVHINRINLSKSNHEEITTVANVSGTSTSVTVSVANTSDAPRTPIPPLGPRNVVKTNTTNQTREVTTSSAQSPFNRPLLTRGVTEAVILRPSRKDVNLVNRARIKPQLNITNPEVQSNVPRNEIFEQRRRSSSTSDAQGLRNRSNNNNSSTSNNNNNNSIVNQANSNDSRRIQTPPQPFRATGENAQHAVTRMTLREQQVLQLRREMMHPGGVRLQLRRKDCMGSIAFVDAFGGVWITGWKQKDHPILYNALHIGDQLISIGGVTVSSASDANKIIRNTPSLYVEFIIRRIPFGRVYAIRREIDRQCLGLIRDGNTATIVDVVPNSLSARHGLPPKAQSCDGLSLTFWVLTEINGRPLNLFFKDNEVKDRLNSVGRDISILVQPSDLVTKLKKQMRTLKGHKEYIVQ